MLFDAITRLSVEKKRIIILEFFYYLYKASNWQELNLAYINE